MMNHHTTCFICYKRKRRLSWGVFFVFLFLVGLQAQTEDSLEIPLVRLESKQVEVGEEAVLTLVLVKAPKGLRTYAVFVSVRNSSVACISSSGKGEAIDGLLFQVLEQTGDAIKFRALSLFETRILPGARDIALADIRVKGMKEGKTRIDVRVDAFVDDEGNNVAPNVEPGLLKVATASTGLFIIADSAGVPQDLDGDGLYEDIDGDGKLTLEGVSLFAFNVDSPFVQTHVDHFDFDSDGDVDFDDAVALAKLAKITPSAVERSTPRLFDHSNAVRKAISESDPSLIQQRSGGNQPAGQGGYSEHADSHYQEEALFVKALQLKQCDPEGSSGKENSDGRITDLALLNHDPLSVKIEFENTSTTVLNPEGWLEIRDIAGETIISIPIEAFSLVPGDKQFITCADEDGELHPGTYLALGVIDLGTGCLVAGQRMFVIEGKDKG